jgi:hypothetical protein
LIVAFFELENPKKPNMPVRPVGRLETVAVLPRNVHFCTPWLTPALVAGVMWVQDNH